MHLTGCAKGPTEFRTDVVGGCGRFCGAVETGRATDTEPGGAEAAPVRASTRGLGRSRNVECSKIGSESRIRDLWSGGDCASRQDCLGRGGHTRLEVHCRRRCTDTAFALRAASKNTAGASRRGADQQCRCQRAPGGVVFALRILILPRGRKVPVSGKILNRTGAFFFPLLCF